MQITTISLSRASNDAKNSIHLKFTSNGITNKDKNRMEGNGGNRCVKKLQRPYRIIPIPVCEKVSSQPSRVTLFSSSKFSLVII